MPFVAPDGELVRENSLFKRLAKYTLLEDVAVGCRFG